jgi:hypothetical protein
MGIGNAAKLNIYKSRPNGDRTDIGTSDSMVDEQSPYGQKPNVQKLHRVRTKASTDISWNRTKTPMDESPIDVGKS